MNLLTKLTSLLWCTLSPVVAAEVRTDAGTLLPRIITPLRFEDFSVVGSVTAKGAERLRHEKLHAGGQEAYEFLMDTAKGSYVRTDTIGEYEKAIKSGANPQTTYDDAMRSWFQEASAALSFLKRARPARFNPFENYDLRRLPVGWLHWNGSEERTRLEYDQTVGRTLNDYAHRGRIRNLKKSESSVSFIYGKKRYEVQVIATGDHDHDDRLDLLLSVASYYLEGSGRSYGMYLVQAAVDGRVTAAVFGGN
jgi:hypothetical protein